MKEPLPLTEQIQPTDKLIARLMGIQNGSTVLILHGKYAGKRGTVVKLRKNGGGGDGEDCTRE